MELWELRRDHAGHCPAGRQMVICAHAKKHQQAPRTAFVTNLSRCQGKKNSFQHRNAGYPTARELPWHCGLAGGAAARDGEMLLGAHPTPQPITVPLGHPTTPRSQRGSADRFSHGVQGAGGGQAPSKSQQRTRRLFRIERRSLVCSTSCEMKIHPKCKFGPLKRRV